MQIILNKTRSHSERFKLISGSMGGAGEHSSHANNNFEVVNGKDNGCGYSCYMSVEYALSSKSFMPKEVKVSLKKHLAKLGYDNKTLSLTD